MRRFFQTILVLTLVQCMGVESLVASGTYPPAPPRLRADITAEIDPAAYNQGKLIFAGKAKLDSSSVSSAQAQQNREALEELTSRIPERAREQLDVAELATKMNQSEYDALLYYLRLRFRLSEVTV